jgi:Flp pilus assembly pilin Flp
VTGPEHPRDVGASSVEYALLLGAIAAVVVFAVFVLGGAVRGLFEDTCSRIDAQVTVAATC